MANTPASSLFARVEALLPRVERPSRYLNHEYQWAGDTPNTSPEGYRAVFLYPDTYEIGQANQAIAILHHIVNQSTDVCAERAFLPWLDMIALMRAEGIPLFSLETYRPVIEANMLAITLPHELALTNVLEALDLAGLPLYAHQRLAVLEQTEQAEQTDQTGQPGQPGANDKPKTKNYPLVIGGGPLTANPEPIAAFFDALAIGEGEELISEVIALQRDAEARVVSRRELLSELATIKGIYVPSLEQLKVRKRILADFDAWPIITNPLVPYAEVTHDRLNIEILRGCTRGCRFCQAGMTYRPVRERQANTIVAAVQSGLACTGYDEVSLTSLSSTDHSQIEQILRRLQALLDGQGQSISLPSQRLDAFGVAMAHQVKSGARRTGLTFAPEAGTQRLRDVINKNVSEDDLLSAVQAAFAAGWRRCKLYFMIGLPTETDDDIQGIAALANLAYNSAKDSVPNDQRSRVRMSVSVAVFVPKAQTPFQWQGQISRSEAERRIALLRNAGLHKGIDLHWHDPESSVVEAAFSRAGRECSQLVEAAWRAGALFDAWSERFSLLPWEQACEQLGISLATLAERNYEYDEELPWDRIDFAIDKSFLWAEAQAALRSQTTPDCSFTGCSKCGVCDNLSAEIVLAGERHE